MSLPPHTLPNCRTTELASCAGSGSRTGRGLRVVCFGGGTGLSNLLRGLKAHLSGKIEQLTAVVAVTDDGGSSGRLRGDFHGVAPGDIRNCLVALAEDEALLSRMFQYRFTQGAGLEGHSFGNLFLTVLAALTEDFVEAVRLSSELLGTRGRILPASAVPAQLGAELHDGTFVVGESAITRGRGGIRRVFLLPRDTPAVPETLAAIAEADMITIGPGSLFTSLAPNLLVPGIAAALASSPARKVFICNLMTQANETLGMTASDHLQALEDHAGCAIFDAALVNCSPFPAALLQRYAQQEAEPVSNDMKRHARGGIHIVQGEYLSPGSVARHDAEAVARDLMRFVAEFMTAALAA
ncbi:MAG: YvcK family protein [Acidobacteria bacterium]|nr:YvcK family protein [Acidobacteriota bacterium]